MSNFSKLLIGGLIAISGFFILQSDWHAKDLESAQITQKNSDELVKRGCADLSKNTSAEKFMPDSAVPYFKEAAQTDSQYSKLSEAAVLLSIADNQTISKFTDATKNQMVLAIGQIKLWCIE